MEQKTLGLITTLSIMTFSISALNKVTFSIMALSIMTSSITKENTTPNIIINTDSDCYNADCFYP